MDLATEQERMKKRQIAGGKRKPRHNHSEATKKRLFDKFGVEKPLTNFESELDDEIREIVQRKDLICPYCLKEPTVASYRTGLLSPCKRCRIKKVLLRKYNLTLHDFRRMLVEQNYRCAICALEFDASAGRHCTACVDHCHDLNHVRGLLCGRCNRAIGLFLEDTESLKNAIKYLTLNKLRRVWSISGEST